MIAVKLVHPKHGISVPVDNRRDETRLRALGYVDVPEAPAAQPELPIAEVAEPTEPETPAEAPKPRTRSRKSD